jgi:hypothetical protein
VIAVLYGRQSPWVRNVMAAGSFILSTKGHDHLLVRPELIGPAQAIPAHPALHRATFRARDIQDFVWGHHAELY